MAEFTLKRQLKISPKVLWEIFSDFGHSRDPNTKVELEQEGNPHQYQVGAIRKVTTNGRTVREKLVAVDPGRFLTYQILEGPPVKDYFGTIAIRPQDGGTYLEWKVTYRPKFPWPAFLINRTAKKIIRNLLDDLERTFSAQSAA